VGGSVFAGCAHVEQASGLAGIEAAVQLKGADGGFGLHCVHNHGMNI
jgi:hypothetical protein